MKNSNSVSSSPNLVKMFFRMKIQLDIFFMIIMLYIDILVFQGTMVLITFPKKLKPIRIWHLLKSITY
jgi:hypothetical protein